MPGIEGVSIFVLKFVYKSVFCLFEDFIKEVMEVRVLDSNDECLDVK